MAIFGQSAGRQRKQSGAGSFSRGIGFGPMMKETPRGRMMLFQPKAFGERAAQVSQRVQSPTVGRPAYQNPLVPAPVSPFRAALAGAEARQGEVPEFSQGYEALNAMRGGSTVNDLLLRGETDVGGGQFMPGGQRMSYGMMPQPPLDEAMMNRIATARQAQQTTPQYAMQANFAGGGFPTRLTSSEPPPASLFGPVQQPSVEDISTESGRYVPSGRSTSAYGPPATESGTRVEEGIFGGPRLVGPRHGMSSEDRAAARQRSLDSQRQRMELPMQRQADVGAFRQQRAQEGFGQLSPARQQYVQQRYGRTFGAGQGPAEAEGSGMFPRGYRPVTDEAGNVNRQGTAQEAMSFIENFQGDRQSIEQELQRFGMNWDDMRDYAARELLPSLMEKSFNWTRFGVIPFFSEGDRIGLQKRARQYQSLRRLDPSLPPMPWQLQNFLTKEDEQAEQSQNTPAEQQPLTTQSDSPFGVIQSRTPR